MLGIATRVLRLAFGEGQPDVVSEAADAEIEFAAYAHECLLAGRLRLDADRLTDLLNGADEVELLDIVCLSLNGELVETERATIRRSELLAVKAGDPRGNAVRRHRTRQTGIRVAAGPYVITGYAHSRPGADPMIDIGRRPPMIPLTDASISYEVGGVWRREEASTLIVNRDAAAWIKPARERDFMAAPGAA
jgi:hypothetical protein